MRDPGAEAVTGVLEKGAGMERRKEKSKKE
jgi:hypothetical protein